MSRALAIINPISGTGSKRSLPELLGRAYNGSPQELFITYTKAAGHGFELARQAAAEGYDRVIAVGGDGTVNEIARALVGTETALAIVPKGSGNGLARSLGVSMNSERAAEQAATGQRVAIDTCQMNGQPFFCTCGVGFDAAVSHAFAEAAHRGPLTYLQTMVQEYQSFRPQHYHLEMDEGRRAMDTDAFVLVVANAAQYGNNAMIAPEADLTDGELDLALIRPFSPLDAPLILGDLMRGRLLHNKYYHTERIQQVSIDRPSSGPVHLDGEPFDMGTHLNVQLLPESLWVIIPD